jgi:hypothetical protein
MKLFIATPMYGGIAKNNYTISLQNLIVKLSKAGYSVTTTTVGNESLITRARNTLVHKFMNSDCEALLFIDADHGWNADDVLKMIESGKDFIGAIYPMKGINWENVRLAAQLNKENLEAYSGHFALNFLDEEQKFEVNEPFKVKDIGTGMLFLTRKVFEDLKPHCKQYKNNNVGNTGIEFGGMVTEYFTTFVDENQILLSEDYALCRMWQAIDGEVWSAPWVRITHSGDYNFSGQFANMLEINQERQNILKKIETDMGQAPGDLVEEPTEAENKEPSEQ